MQALLGGLGLAIADVPFVAILTALMFMLPVAQIGALPVLVPAVLRLFWSDVAWGSFMAGGHGGGEHARQRPAAGDLSIRGG